MTTRGDHGCIKHMFLWQSCCDAMLFGDEAPSFLGLDAPEQLNADAIHLCGMQEVSLLLPCLFEENCSCMEVTMTGLAKREEIAVLVTSTLASKDEVMHFQAGIL